MKKISLLLVLTLVVSVLAGCAGTPVVYYSDCTCPTGAHDAAVPEETAAADPLPGEVDVAEGALKTGLAIVTKINESKAATADAEGEAKYDVTMVAVLVDDNGVIQDCIIDGIAASVKFDAAGAITTDLTAAPQTKNELGENYGMVAYGNAVAEWDDQAAALAAFAIGKDTVQLRNGAIDETGYAPEGTDLATSATIYLGGYVEAIEQAVANAKHLGAQAGDTLKLAAIAGIDASTSADAENAGNAQLDVTATALTMNGDIITSCAIDAVQAKVGFDASGAIPAELPAPQTKNELGEAYGMKKASKIGAEWNAQADAFATYIVDKTLEEVQGIAVTETTKPAEGTDLATSVTIAIGGFQALINKACK